MFNLAVSWPNQEVDEWNVISLSFAINSTTISLIGGAKQKTYLDIDFTHVENHQIQRKLKQ